MIKNQHFRTEVKTAIRDALKAVSSCLAEQNELLNESVRAAAEKHAVSQAQFLKVLNVLALADAPISTSPGHRLTGTTVMDAFLPAFRSLLRHAKGKKRLGVGPETARAAANRSGQADGARVIAEPERVGMCGEPSCTKQCQLILFNVTDRADARQRSFRCGQPAAVGQDYCARHAAELYENAKA